MNKFFLNIIGIMSVIALMFACAKPDAVLPNDKANITDFYATYDGEGRTRTFNSRISNDTVYLDVDYYYPINSDTEVDLTKMLLKASIPVDSKISPSLTGFTDLTNPFHITVTAGNGIEREYVIVANKKGNTDVLTAKLTYEDFLGATQELDGIIIGKTISFSAVPGTAINNSRLTYSLNRHATASINNGASVDLATPIPFEVYSAGNAKSVYTLQVIEAQKLAKGIRPGSAKILFAKKLKADVGITADNVTTGLSVSGEYLIINNRGENSKILNALTGANVGTLSLGSVAANINMNMYATSDQAGNILVNNFSTGAGGTSFKLWKISSITGTPEEIISWPTGGVVYGAKVSVIGDVNTNAIITAPRNGATGSNTFARWQISNGSLVSQTPTIVTTNNYTWNWSNADVIYTNPTNVNSDYYAVSYGGPQGNKLSKFSGLTNSFVSQMEALNSNFVSNAVAFQNFNNANFVAFNHANGATWGSADNVFLIDADLGLVGDPSNSASTIWKTVSGTYGPLAAQGPVNLNVSDVIMSTSSNGYFMYLYFMFANGYVVGVQFDCVDL